MNDSLPWLLFHSHGYFDPDSWLLPVISSRILLLLGTTTSLIVLLDYAHWYINILQYFYSFAKFIFNYMSIDVLPPESGPL